METEGPLPSYLSAYDYSYVYIVVSIKYLSVFLRFLFKSLISRRFLLEEPNRPSISVFSSFPRASLRHSRSGGEDDGREEIGEPTQQGSSDVESFSGPLCSPPFDLQPLLPLHCCHVVLICPCFSSQVGVVKHLLCLENEFFFSSSIFFIMLSSNRLIFKNMKPQLWY